MVNEALKRGAKRVYAATRVPMQIVDECVTPLKLDVTGSSQIQRAVGEVRVLEVLINNAGIADTVMVLVVEHGKKPSPELVERANGIRLRWMDYWETTTGHRASMTTEVK